jgi:F0F1-type ATP synthase delta subunit
MATLKARDLVEVLYRLTSGAADDAAVRGSVRRFVAAVHAKGLGAMLPLVMKAFAAAHDAHAGLTPVAVETARALPEGEIDAALAALGLTRAKARLTVAVRPELIGGLSARTSDRLLDVTVRARLEALRQRMNGGAAVRS